MDIKQGEPKNTPARKLQYLRNVRIFLPNFAHLFRRQPCTGVLLSAVFKLMETQTSWTNFETVQTVQNADFITKVIECPIPLLLSCHCDVGIVIWVLWQKN